MDSVPPTPAVLLMQWTLLLALGWGVHALVREWHPRWRLILWRSILCFGVILPLLSVVSVPRMRVSLLPLATPLPPERGMAPGGASTSAAARPIPLPPALAAKPRSFPAGTANASSVSFPPWWVLLFFAWFAGFSWEAGRLLWLQVQLRRIARQAVPASAPIQSLAGSIRAELKISRDVCVLISDAISSPFLCGVREPAILIPRNLMQEFPPAEIAALLSHEMAHQCRHDLAWCIAWRVMKAAYWFHPLVWRIPNAHVLACEEEADQIAAARHHSGEAYPQLLAQMALRVLRIPAAETRLTLNATAHLTRRLIKLGRERTAAWRLSYTVTAFAGVVLLLVLTAGWQFGQVPESGSAAVQIPTAAVLVTVQDEGGNPIAGATITPNGLRALSERLRGAHYGWMPERHGPAMEAVTDSVGKAWIRYPVAVVPAEQVLTVELSLLVDHSEYSSVWTTSYPVDGAAEPVRLKLGIPLRVAGYFGPTRERVTEIVPHLVGDSRGVRPGDWRREPDGSLAWRRMSPGRHFLHLAGRLPSGEIVYSDGVAFFGEQRDSHDLKLELKPGLRVEGRIDARVPRPIKDGWVQLSVHDEEANTQDLPPFLPKTAGNTGFWWSYRPVASDGSFVFESVPPGELKVIAYGDGFISINGAAEEFPMPPGARVSQPARRVTRGVPQSFDAVRPVTTIEVLTEATATLKVTTKNGRKPVPGARISISPNVIQMPTGSRLYGGRAPSSEEPFRKLTPLREPEYSAVTDDRGTALLRNVPAFTHSLTIMHPHFEVPLREPKRDLMIPNRSRALPNRYVEVALSPGQTGEVEVAVQPRGGQFIGENP